MIYLLQLNFTHPQVHETKLAKSIFRLLLEILRIHI